MMFGEDKIGVRSGLSLCFPVFAALFFPQLLHIALDLRAEDADGTQFNVEMKKADRLRDRLPPALADWIVLFEHWHEEHFMATITDSAVLKARDKLEALSADAEARRLAFVRERALLDEASLLKDARGEGEKAALRRTAANLIYPHVLAPLRLFQSEPQQQ